MSDEYRLLRGVLVSACEHMHATGACDDADPESGDSLCEDPTCAYCNLALTIDALPEEMKP
jgi:hypothetical protein